MSFGGEIFVGCDCFVCQFVFPLKVVFYIVLGFLGAVKAFLSLRLLALQAFRLSVCPCLFQFLSFNSLGFFAISAVR